MRTVRSMMNPNSKSELSVHVRLTLELDVAVSCRLLGAAGGVTVGVGSVVVLSAQDSVVAATAPSIAPVNHFLKALMIFYATRGKSQPQPTPHTGLIMISRMNCCKRQTGW